jgi:hypothetical protein
MRVFIGVFAFLLMQLPLHSVEFVLFTQPKTGRSLVTPILEELTGRKLYWPKKEMDLPSNSIRSDYMWLLNDPSYIFFSSGKGPWTKKKMDEVWALCQNKGYYLHLHPPYLETMENYLIKKGAVNFFVRRDPRDQIISLLNHYKNIDFMDPVVKAIPSDEERLLYMIKYKMRGVILAFKGWIHSPVCCVLDFSKLMGAHGGASTDADALGEMRKIANALELDSSDEFLEKVYRKHFGHSWNFFKGKVGVWKEVFNEEHKAAAKEAIGDLLIELGYEQDYDW